MKKRFLQVSVLAAFMVLIFSFSAFAGEGITDITEKRYEAAIAHLNELYIKKNPEGALTVYEGSYNDKKMLEQAAKEITKGAKTDEEKARKIYDWMEENLTYDLDYSSLAIDTYKNRKSQCYGYTNLRTALFRYAGVPAVTVTGWKGSMTGEWVQSEEELHTQNIVNGHAWTMAYINGKWELFDCLYDDFMLSEEEIIKWNYFERIDNLFIHYDGMEFYQLGMYYKDGKVVYLDENGKEITEGGYFATINNVSVRWPYDAYKYQKTDSKKKIINKDVMQKSGTYVRYDYYDSKIAFAPIKTKPDGTIQNYHAFTYKKNTVYTESSGGSVFLDIPVKDVKIYAGGSLEVIKGEKIRMYPLLDSVKKKYKVTYRYRSDDTSIATVDKNGYINGKAYGYTMIWVDMYNAEGRHFHTENIYIFVNDKKTTHAGAPAGAVLKIERKFINVTTMKLLWEKAEDTTEYIILVKDKNGNYNRIGTTTECSFILKNLQKDYKYEIIIKTVLKRNGGISYGAETSAIVHGMPKKVKGLDFENISVNGNKASVTLCWRHIGEDSPFSHNEILDFYQVYQLKNGKWEKIGTVDRLEASQFTVKKLKPGKTYSFKVRAVSSGEGNGEAFSEKIYGKFSKVIKVTVPKNIGKVKNVKKSLSGTTLNLSWNRVKDADRYMVFEYNTKKDKWVKVATVTGTRATLKKVSKNKNHKYKVRAYDEKVKSTGEIITRVGAFSKVVKVKI